MIRFYKYQGTGNDFIIIDQLQEPFDLSRSEIEFLCNRKMGIGADGLMLLRNSDDADFQMIYYNSDGKGSTMCGNGGRCISSLYFSLSGKNKATFEAVDGFHDACLQEDGNISLLMSDVKQPASNNGHLVINTGSPHYVKKVEDVTQINVTEEGASVRYSKDFKDEGINVNFLQIIDESSISVRTYERGVEGETLSCGTGVTACALATHILTGSKSDNSSIAIHTKGGDLEVRFNTCGKDFQDIWLIGPAVKVFEGLIRI